MSLSVFLSLYVQQKSFCIIASSLKSLLPSGKQQHLYWRGGGLDSAILVAVSVARFIDTINIYYISSVMKLITTDRCLIITKISYNIVLQLKNEYN